MKGVYIGLHLRCHIFDKCFQTLLKCIFQLQWGGAGASPTQMRPAHIGEKKPVIVATKYRIRQFRPLRQDKPTYALDRPGHRADLFVGVGVTVVVRLGLAKIRISGHRVGVRVRVMVRYVSANHSSVRCGISSMWFVVLYQVQAIDMSFLQDLRQRYPTSCSHLVTTSPVLRLTASPDTRSAASHQPMIILVPVPPSPVKRQSTPQPKPQTARRAPASAGPRTAGNWYF